MEPKQTVSDADVAAAGRLFGAVNADKALMRVLASKPDFAPVLSFLRLQKRLPQPLPQSPPAEPTGEQVATDRAKQVAIAAAGGGDTFLSRKRARSEQQVQRRPEQRVELAPQSPWVPAPPENAHLPQSPPKPPKPPKQPKPLPLGANCCTSRCRGRTAPPHAHTHRYPRLCLGCATINAAKRERTAATAPPGATLEGRVCVVTGARVKIGFHIALKLLRGGATVICTTRFPADAARRFGAEPDFDAWAPRLTLYGADFRDVGGVIALCEHLRARCTHVDLLVNNAAQTVRRPPAFYAHLLEGELLHLGSLPPAQQGLLAEGWHRRVSVGGGGAGSALAPPAPPEEQQLALQPYQPQQQQQQQQQQLALCTAMPMVPLVRGDSVGVGEARGGVVQFPRHALDSDGQQVDQRSSNSWVSKLGAVTAVELLECQTINASVPALLCAQLRPLLRASPHRRKFVVNVSAMEGQFHRWAKTSAHPHTNMAKAALNMLTRTCAHEYREDGIYMTAVDTGWVTNENPFADERERQRHPPPLDAVDGAARVLDPVLEGLAAAEGDDAAVPYGVFLKDFAPVPW